MFVISGLIIGPCITRLMSSHFGVSLAQFEALCVFSSLRSVLISFVLKIAYSYFPQDKVMTPPQDYQGMIDELAHEKEAEYDGAKRGQ